MHDALVDLTGGVAETIDCTEIDGALQAGLWSRLRDIHEAGHLLGAGSPAGTDPAAGVTGSEQLPMGAALAGTVSEAARPLWEGDAHGIIAGHAYAVLELREVTCTP